MELTVTGGGFVFGGLQADAKFCATVQEKAGLVVVDVNYRHCPGNRECKSPTHLLNTLESEFGKNIEDSWAALNWVSTASVAKDLNIDPDYISIGGISAGAHLCAVLQHICRDAHIPLRLAVLAVPVCTDFATYTKPSDSPFPSFTEFSKGAMLNWERMAFFGRNLFPVNKESIRAALPKYWLEPLNAPNFAGLCEVFLISAECDPVRDEGEAYGRKVHEAGTKVTFKRYATLSLWESPCS